MDRTVVLFLKAGLGWLVAGVTLGVGMALAPSLTAYRTAHIHMLLLGFVTGMIFGVGLPLRLQCLAHAERRGCPEAAAIQETGSAPVDRRVMPARFKCPPY